MGEEPLSLEQRIEQTLGVLTGLRLLSATRERETCIFQFGERANVVWVRVGRIIIGEYALHVRCPWRLIGSQGLVVASGDRDHPVDPSEEELPEWVAKEAGTRLDQRLLGFLVGRPTDPLRVEAVETDAAAALRVAFADGYRLEVLPVTSAFEEHWRFRGTEPDADHFVIKGQEITSG